MSKFKQYMQIIQEMQVNKDMLTQVKNKTINPKDLREKSLQGMSVKINNENDISKMTFNLNGKEIKMDFSRTIKDDGNHYDTSNQRHYFYVSINGKEEEIDDLQTNMDFPLESSDYVDLIKGTNFKKILLKIKLSNSEIKFVVDKIIDLMDNGADSYSMFPDD